MARENPTWGRRRIQAEPRFLGYDLAELTVAKYMRRRSPSFVLVVLARQRRCVLHFNVTEHPTADWTAQQIVDTFPWQNPFAERLIDSVRRECLDHVLVLSERHLRRVLTRYFAYYHRARTHLSLDKDAPDVRLIERPGIVR